VRKLVVALAATFAVLLATGIYQAYRYVPSWAPAPGSGSSKPADHGFVYDATETIHRVGAWVFCALVVAVVVVWVRRELGTTRSKFISVVVLAVLALATLAQMITGRGLRWSQLALWAVTAGSKKGVRFGSEVKFVIIGTKELSASEFSTRVFLHLVLFPIGIVLCGVVLWFLSTKWRRRGLQSGPERRNFGDDDEDADVDATTEVPT